MKVDVKFERGDTACVLYASNETIPKIVHVKITAVKITIDSFGEKIVYTCNPLHGGHNFDVNSDKCIFKDTEEMLRTLGKLH